MTEHKRHFLALALALPFALVLLSWVLSALGLPCRSLLSDEGLRWMCRHLSLCLVTPLTQLSFCLVTAVGALQRSGLDKAWRTRRCAVLLGLFVAFWTLLMLLVLSPWSPVLSITGTLWGSPFLQAFPVLLWLSVLTFAVLLGRDASLTDVLGHGLRRYPAVLYLCFITSFLYYCILFVYA